MKPERSFLAERPLAQHCAALVRAVPGPEELIPQLDRAAQRFARALAPALAPFTGGGAPRVKAQAGRRTTLDDVAMFMPDLAANSLIGVGAERLPLLASLDAAAVLRMVDRTFGGRGEAPSPLPDAFSVSAELMIARLEGIVSAALAKALPGAAGGLLEPLRRSGSLTELDPFDRNEPIVALECQVEEPSGDSWIVTLALTLPALCALFGEAPRQPARATARTPADPLAPPFADLPLQLVAVLVDMRLPVSMLAALAPGQVIPVAVARQVPLKLGAQTIAKGQVGSAEDRVALQLSSAF